VLLELRIENLLLIERAELRPGAGLSAITGETGAGKTVLAHALDLLLGGKARSGIVRPGAREAYVEGVFALPAGLLDEPELAELRERIDGSLEEIVLARRVTAEGRTRAFVEGRSATAADLQALGGRLVAFFGQHEHRRLTLASAQLEALDGFCGAAHRGRLAGAAAAHAGVREAEAALEGLRERVGSRDRELDLLRFEREEIEQADPGEAERAELTARRDRLRHAEALRAATLTAAAALTPEEGGPSLAVDALAGVAGLDAEIEGLAVRVRAAIEELHDAAHDLRAVGEGIEGDAAELDAVEERLAVLERLERKHGGTIAAVLEHAERCRARRAELEGAEEAFEEATAALERAAAARAELAAALHEGRATAAPRLAEAVRERLAGLAMEGATFEVVLGEREPGPAGGDAVEFRIAPNPGVPAGALRDIASGGELSRVMLALMGVANADAGPPSRTLVFDEVDAGIGGHTARAVGERLRELGDGRQVVCITHLPQVASLAARHFSIAKDATTDPARTTVEQLAEGAVVGELVRMLGADGADEAARRHAEELLRAA
jgi:DNA repair protein RecN (Recombination protein N)